MAERITKDNGDFYEALDRLSIDENKRYETVVTTNGPHINAAAMGIRRIEDKFQLKIFEMSNTFENIQSDQEGSTAGRFAINLIDSSQLDILCYSALRGWGSPIPEFPEEYFERISETPVLNDAPACIICEPEKITIEKIKDRYGEAYRMDLKAGIIEVLIRDSKEVKPIVRGPDEPLVDALVYATKFKIARGQMKDKCRSKVEGLLEAAGRPTDVAHTLTKEALKEYFGIFD